MRYTRKLVLWATKVARYGAVNPPEYGWATALEIWRALTPAARERIMADASLRADALAHQLDALQDTVAERSPAAALRARAWLLERDDLQSLLLLGEKAGEASEAWRGFRATLRMLDSAGREYLPVFADAGVEDPRLAELSWRDPAAWWGAVAR